MELAIDEKRRNPIYPIHSWPSFYIIHMPDILLDSILVFLRKVICRSFGNRGDDEAENLVTQFAG